MDTPPARGRPPARGEEPRDALAGLVLGDCTLRRPMGRGGMGVVYEGWQEPPGRQVAVKLLGDALASPEARYRFQQEAHVLGTLRHPAIAQVHRAGTHHATTELSYFVMEYIAGALPITEYVQRHGLGLEDALRLVMEVCRGVHAGHVRGVIHRDIKPGNVLVGEDGRPKVIDFGIARLTGDDASPDAPRTRTAHLMGTVTYMSPEQLGGQAESIDTRSDVYALGVLLYEILTGKLPYDLTNLGLLETIGAIRNQPPRAPERLREDLPRDVGIIVRKALAKEPDARYGSAEALAEDIERFLQSRPILARAPSLAYQLRLYARRHRVAFVAMAGGLVVLVGSLVAISVFAASEARARQQAERNERRARALLHESAGFIPVVTDHLDNKLDTLMGATRVRTLLAEEVEGLAMRLAAIEGVSEDPVVLRALAAAEISIGGIKGGTGGANLGDEGAATRYYERAIEHLGQARAARPDDDRLFGAWLAARLTLATHHRAAGRIPEARALLDAVEPDLAALAARRPDDLHVLSARLDHLQARAHTDWYVDDFEAALEGYRQYLEMAKDLDWATFGAMKRDRFLLQAHLNLASAFAELDRDEEAARHIAEVERLAALVQAGPPDRTRLWLLWHVQDSLGDLAGGRKDHEAARGHYAQALAFAQQLAAGDEQDAEAQAYIQDSEGDLAVALEQLERYEEAATVARSALERMRARRAAQPDNLGLEWDERVLLTRLASVLYRLEDFPQARAALRDAQVIQERRLERSGGAAVEACGLAEVESTWGFLHAAEAGAAPDEVVARERYEEARRWFEAAVARLAGVKERGQLSPGFDRNLELWGRLVDMLHKDLGHGAGGADAR
ncbi:MAG: protein kinase [Planctomycetota bacterium]